MPPTERVAKGAHIVACSVASSVALLIFLSLASSSEPSSSDAMPSQYVSLGEVLSVLARPLEEKAVWALLRATSKAISDHEPSESRLS